MNKTTILSIAVILLLLLNITTVVTIFIHSRNEKKTEMVVSLSQEGAGCHLNGKYFKQNLKFDEQQMDAFRSANREFQPLANNIVMEIDSVKTLIFKELKKEKPDTLVLNQLSEETGNLHTELKKETNRFYLKMKKVCNPEQLLQLEDVFSPLFMTNCNGNNTKDCCKINTQTK